MTENYREKKAAGGVAIEVAEEKLCITEPRYDEHTGERKADAKVELPSFDELVVRRTATQRDLDDLDALIADMRSLTRE